MTIDPKLATEIMDAYEICRPTWDDLDSIPAVELEDTIAKRMLGFLYGYLEKRKLNPAEWLVAIRAVLFGNGCGPTGPVEE